MRSSVAAGLSSAAARAASASGYLRRDDVRLLRSIRVVAAAAAALPASIYALGARTRRRRRRAPRRARPRGRTAGRWRPQRGARAPCRSPPPRTRRRGPARCRRGSTTARRTAAEREHLFRASLRRSSGHNASTSAVERPQRVHERRRAGTQRVHERRRCSNYSRGRRQLSNAAKSDRAWSAQVRLPASRGCR